MKLFFSALFIILTQNAICQIIDHKEPLFKSDGFFKKNEIQKHLIKNITVYKSDKKDGKIFQDEAVFLKYNFLKNGNLSLAEKYILLTHRQDTASVEFFYDHHSNVFKRIEKQGPFNFEYYYIFEEGNLMKELKVDGNSLKNDTSYVRYFTSEKDQNSIKKTTYNSIKKPFQVEEFKIDNSSNLIERNLRFIRNSNYQTISYKYQLTYIQSITEQTFFGQLHQRNWEFIYKEGKVDEIVLKDKTNVLTKFVLLYENSLPSAIIERNFIDKKIILYRFKYDFYD